MEELIKLESMNVWVDSNGVYQPNADGTPKTEDIKLCNLKLTLVGC